MYWNNPIQEIKYPSVRDIIAESLHNGNHCIFYDPAFVKNQITYRQSLQDLCDWANRNVQQGIEQFLANPQNHYDIANLVKLNMWIEDIRKQGIVKPMLVSYTPDGYRAANGESRLRALECLPKISTVTAFINCRVEDQSKFEHLESVTTFNHFAELCNSVDGQQFLFRLTAADAPYGIDWYEYNSSRTAPVTPGQEECVELVTAYLKQHPDTVFSHEWFAQPVTWNLYKTS